MYILLQTELTSGLQFLPVLYGTTSHDNHIRLLECKIHLINLWQSWFYDVHVPLLLPLLLDFGVKIRLEYLLICFSVELTLQLDCILQSY